MKYYKNEQWNDLKVKVSDTLPKGTEIDYNGSTVPDGWEEIADYSTSEINTGKKWIDGKPIYRKVINTTSSDTNVNIDLSSLNINNIFINFSKSFFKQGGYTLPLGIYGSTNDWNRCFYASNTLTIQFGSVYTMSKNIYVTIEYTKN